MFYHSKEIIQDVIDVNSHFDMYFLIIHDVSMYKNTIYNTNSTVQTLIHVRYKRFKVHER